MRKILEIPEQSRTLPFLVLSPSLAGAGKIGSEVTVSPGLWGGMPAPHVTLQWCRDGIAIPDATGSSYRPIPEDDLAQLTCRVSATNLAGFVTTETAALAITHLAPVAVGAIIEEIFDQRSDEKIIDAKPFFSGEALRFSVTGGDASIDVLTGEIRIPADEALSETVTVTARNSGGEAAQSFQVTVEEAVEIPDVPDALASGDWDVYWDIDPTQMGNQATWHFEVKSGPALAATRLFWRGDTSANGATPGPGFHACIPHPSRPNHWIARALFGEVKPWLWVNSSNPSHFALGKQISHIAIYTCDRLIVAAESAIYSAASNVLDKVVEIEGDSGTPEPPPSAATRRMPLVFPSEVGVPGYVPADAMQQWHALDWCLGDPDVIYGMQDTGGIWLSRDHGRSWYLPTRYGLKSFQGLGVAVDPVDPRRVLCNMGGSYAPNRPYQGLYASTDGGMTFGPRIIAGVTDSRRGTHSAMAHAPSSIGARRAEKWLAIVDGRFDGDAAVPIVASTDGWATWTQRGTWNHASFGTSSWMVGDRTDEGRFYVACGAGLVRIGNAFSGEPSFTKLSGQGGLPAGGVAGKPYVSADGRTIIVGTGGGIYRSTDAGSSWSRVGGEDGFAKLQVNPYDPEHMILIYGHRSRQQRPKYSTDGGASFSETAASAVERRPGLRYSPAMMYNFAHAAFHSTPGHVWLCARQTQLPAAANHYRTTDYGAYWSLSTEGFNGANFSNRGATPFMFCRNNKNRFVLSFVDIGPWLTTNGGKSFSAPNYTGAQAGGHTTAHGAAVHPDATRSTVFGAVGVGSEYVLLRSLDDGATWDVPLGLGAISGGPTIVFDVDNPAYVFWGRWRNTNHGVGSWSAMEGLSAAYGVMACTLTALGMSNGQALFALDIRGDVKTISRSLNRGANWSEVLVMPYNNMSSASRYGPFRAHPSDPNVLFTRGPASHIIRKWSLAGGSAARRPFVDLNIFGPGNRPSGLSTDFEVSYLAIDPRFPDVMYTLTMHAGSPRVYRTTDGGVTTWTPLPDVFPLVCNANGIEVSPITGDVIMGGSNGTFIAPPPYAQTGTLFGGLSQPSYLQTTAW